MKENILDKVIGFGLITHNLACDSPDIASVSTEQFG